MSDAVTPGQRTGVVALRLPARQYLVDVSENQSFLGRRQDRHRDQRDVRLSRFPAGGKVGWFEEVTCWRTSVSARVVRGYFGHR